MSELDQVFQTVSVHDPLSSTNATALFRECWLEMTKGIEPKGLRETLAVLDECHALFCKKHDSYGPGNISAFGTLGVTVRLSDKVQRLIHLVGSGRVNPLADESIEDTFKDIINYGVIALMIQRGQWPGIDLGTVGDEDERDGDNQREDEDPDAWSMVGMPGCRKAA